MEKIAITCFLSKSDIGKSICLCEVKWAAELLWGEQLRILDSRLVLKWDLEGKKTRDSTTCKDVRNIFRSECDWIRQNTFGSEGGVNATTH